MYIDTYYVDRIACRASKLDQHYLCPCTPGRLVHRCDKAIGKMQGQMRLDKLTNHKRRNCWYGKRYLCSPNTHTSQCGCFPEGSERILLVSSLSDSVQKRNPGCGSQIETSVNSCVKILTVNTRTQQPFNYQHPDSVIATPFF